MPPAPRFFFEGPQPTPSPMEGISHAMADFRTPGMDPEQIQTSIAMNGPVVMKNFLANVAQNRTIPAVTGSVQAALDQIAGARIVQLAEDHPEFMNRLFAPSEGTVPPGMAELIGSAGQLRGGPNDLSKLAQTLMYGGNVQDIAMLTQSARARLSAASQDPEIFEMGEIAQYADEAGMANAENPEYALANILDAIETNLAFRSAPSQSAGPYRNLDARWGRDLRDMSGADNDPLIAVYESLEEAGVPADSIFHHLSRKLFEDFDQNPTFSGEGNLAPFMNRDRTAADMTEAALPTSGLPPSLAAYGPMGGKPYQPDIGLFFKAMGIDR